MGESLGTLLRAASEPVGDVRPPAVAELVARRRRRTGLRTAAAVVATVATVVTVAAVVANRPDRPGRHDVPPPISRPRPAAIGVSVDQLADYRWRALPPAPIPPRDGATAVWTGHQVIVWGGTRDDQDRADGAAYDPVTRRWTALPPSPVAGADALAVWTGRAMVVWTSEQGGASYDPANDTWTRLPAVPDADVTALVAWQGRAVLLHAARTASVVHADAYDAATKRWQHLPGIALRGGHAATLVISLNAGGVPYAWVDWSQSRKDGSGNYEITSGVDGYRYANGRWAAAPSGPAEGMAAIGAVAVGAQVYFPDTNHACLTCPGPMIFEYRGRLVDPRTGDGTTAPTLGGVGTGDYASTGSSVLVLNSSAEVGGSRGTKPGDISAWEPGRTRWVRLPAAPLDGGEEAAVLWAGDRLFVWGSRGGLEFAG